MKTAMARRRYKGPVQYSLQALRESAARRQGNLCYWCKEPMVPCSLENEGNPSMVTAEHLIPKHAGGETKPGNIVAACAKCNHHRHPELNKAKGGGTMRVTVGEDVPSSPFEVLKGCVVRSD